MSTLQAQYFRAVTHLFAAYAIYLPSKRALTISLPLAEFVFKNVMHENADLVPSFAYMTQEGTRRGLWHVAIERASGIEMLVIQPEGHPKRHRTPRLVG